MLPLGYLQREYQLLVIFPLYKNNRSRMPAVIIDTGLKILYNFLLMQIYSSEQRIIYSRIFKYLYSISRQTSPVFTDSLRIVPSQETQQMSMAMPYVEQFKFDEVLNRYNQRNGMFSYEMYFCTYNLMFLKNFWFIIN